VIEVWCIYEEGDEEERRGGDACMNDITVGHVCSCISKAALLAFIVPYLGRNEREGITLILFHCSAVLPYTILH
jgi:hypothetical protein